MKIYDPFSRSPDTVARVRACAGRNFELRATTVIHIETKGRKSRMVKRGKRMVRKVTFHG